MTRRSGTARQTTAVLVGSRTRYDIEQRTELSHAGDAVGHHVVQSDEPADPVT